MIFGHAKIFLVVYVQIEGIEIRVVVVHANILQKTFTSIIALK